MSKELISSSIGQLNDQQRLFNEYSRQIQSLQQKLTKEKERLDALQRTYHKDIHILFEQLSQERIALALLLHEATYDFKYSNSQLEIFGEVILYLFEQSFASIEPTEDQLIIYQQWKGQSFQNVQEQNIAQLKEQLAEKILMEFGVYIQVDDYGDTLEEFARFRRDAQLLIEQANPSDKQKKSKKKAKEIAKTEAENALKQKSIRSIYLSLAKVLHPDIKHPHMDASTQEEWMKKVTAAYQAKDLHSLLLFENEWVDQQNHRLETLKEDQLNVYLQSLKERLKSLENEIQDLYRSSLYADIAHLIKMQDKKAMQKMKSEKSEVKHAIETFRHNLSYLKSNYSKKVMQDIVNQFHQLI